jgi:hypothetical protein
MRSSWLASTRTTSPIVTRLFFRDMDRIAATIGRPDQVRCSRRFAVARLFSQWHSDLKEGKHVVVVVVGLSDNSRYWIITAYIARKLAAGEVEWARN